MGVARRREWRSLRAIPSMFFVLLWLVSLLASGTFNLEKELAFMHRVNFDLWRWSEDKDVVGMSRLGDPRI